MNDSTPNADLPDREQRQVARLEQVRRWAEYIQDEPPEVWGPQLNKLVNAQLEAARAASIDPGERERIRASARRLAERD